MTEAYTTLDLERRATDGELKASLLEMLLAFDAFCKEHGLVYYLSGGTLLGAVRHKGFIPWDDDIDVNMPRPDCEKLMELSGGKIGKFTLVPPNNMPRSFAYHWKLYDNDVLVAKRERHGKNAIGKKIYPAFMDIFPIDGLPDSYSAASRHYDKIKKIKQKARFQSFLPRYLGRNPFKKLQYKLARIYFRLFVFTDYHAEVIKHAKTYAYEGSDHVGVMMTDVHGIVERVEKAEYAPVVPMEFEGKTVQAPAGFQTYLEQLYGPDYMAVLPPHKQVSRHSLVPFIRKKTVATKPTKQQRATDSAAFAVIRGRIEETLSEFDLDRIATEDELRAALFELLIEFDAFCSKHDLKYFLAGKTLLGAVCHNGFSPWDNSLTVNMPRPDCERLMRLSGGMIGRFVLVPPNSARSAFSFHWKLQHDDIAVFNGVIGNTQQLLQKLSLASMEIFPLDGLPASFAKARAHHRRVSRMQKKARLQAFAPKYRGLNPVRKLKFNLTQFRLRFFDVTNYHDRAIELARVYPYDACEHVGVVAGSAKGLVERMVKIKYEPAICMDFEGAAVQCPQGFEEYLERIFGESYMADPPPHRQFSEKAIVAFKIRKSARIDQSSLLDGDTDGDETLKEA